MILIALFCNLMSLCVFKPHSKMLLLKCGAISELYMILRVYFGRKCFSLFITPNVRDICDPSGRNQSHVGRVRFPLWAKMHGRAHITDSCFIAFITSKIC